MPSLRLSLSCAIVACVGVYFMKKKFYKKLEDSTTTDSKKKIEEVFSVNYHFTRQCNYSCKFCFHTAKNSNMLPLDQAKFGIRLLREKGMQKINFSGGEPFLHAHYLGELVKYSKELGLNTSLVSNGSLVKEDWFQKYGKDLDYFAVSCDSFVEETNKRIGRGKGNHLSQVLNIQGWCEKYDVVFKINSVINIHNWEENMNEPLQILKPKRWKVFQCLLLETENIGAEALRNASDLVVTSEQFQKFLNRHSSLKHILVPESNSNMKDSYLILDENMSFLNCQAGGKKPGPSILDVGVEEALTHAGFDWEIFKKRGGIYIWMYENYTYDKKKIISQEPSSMNPSA